MIVNPAPDATLNMSPIQELANEESRQLSSTPLPTPKLECDSTPAALDPY